VRVRDYFPQGPDYNPSLAPTILIECLCKPDLLPFNFLYLPQTLVFACGRQDICPVNSRLSPCPPAGRISANLESRQEYFIDSSSSKSRWRDATCSYGLPARPPGASVVHVHPVFEAAYLAVAHLRRAIVAPGSIRHKLAISKLRSLSLLWSEHS